MNEWIVYQPLRTREKAFHDIKLRDGAVIECCWPNADAWTPMDGKHSGKSIKDYRVTHIRRCEHPMDRDALLLNKGDRVRVCNNPLCGHNGGITGTVDIIGYFVDSSEPNTRMATVMKDGGGMVGPFRLNELTRITEIAPATGV
jgi:hypothetical protein